MRLVLVELRRLSWRTAVRLLALGALVVPLLMLASLAWETKPVSAAELRQAQERIDRDRQMSIDECVAHPRDWGVPDTGDVAAACEEMVGEWGTPEDYLGYQTLTPSYDAPSLGRGAAGVVGVLALLIGATFAGADWASGSTGNQLLFEPRRARVWLAKAAALVLATLAVFLASTLLWWGGFAALAAWRDAEMGGALWRDLQLLGLRGLLLAGMAALGGYAVTMLLRSTVGTLGVVFAVSVLGSLVVTLLPVSDVQRWFLPNNVAAVIENGYQYWDDTLPTCNPMEGEEGCTGTVTLGEGLRFLGVLLAGVVALSLASFLRRDVP